MKQRKDDSPMRGIFLTVVGLGLVTALLLLLSTATAQAADVPPFDPGDSSTWFGSEAAIVAFVALLTGLVVQMFTALGKDWFHTEGPRTVLLSAAIAVLLGGVAGWFTQGIFEDGPGGWTGAVQAGLTALWAFLQSNAVHKMSVQQRAAALKRASAEMEQLDVKR